MTPDNLRLLDRLMLELEDDQLFSMLALAWEVHMYGVVDEADFECLLPGIGCLVTQARRILAPLLFPEAT